jgi:biopolymer transport protein ExbB/TolQ
VESTVNLLAILENGLFALGQVLRFPVMVLLWICVASAIFLAGSCLVDAVARTRERRSFNLANWLKAGPALGASPARRETLPLSLRQLIGDAELARAAGMLTDGGLEHLVLEREERLRRSLNGARMLVKLGPMLGLLGTLIPMGVSLASLASGNLEAMAGQMVVAFTTTIIGLATGAVAYIVVAVRHNWITDLIREQRYIAERMLRELTREAA